MVKNQKALLKKLKRQIRLSQSKANRSRNQLRATVKKMRKMASSYKRKLSGKMRLVQSKVGAAQAAAYIKAAAEVQRQIHKRITARAKALNSALARSEKKFASRVGKNITKKARKVGKIKKVSKSKKRPSSF